MLVEPTCGRHGVPRRLAVHRGLAVVTQQCTSKIIISQSTRRQEGERQEPHIEYPFSRQQKAKSGDSEADSPAPFALASSNPAASSSQLAFHTRRSGRGHAGERWRLVGRLTWESALRLAISTDSMQVLRAGSASADEEAGPALLEELRRAAMVLDVLASTVAHRPAPAGAASRYTLGSSMLACLEIMLAASHIRVSPTFRMRARFEDLQCLDRLHALRTLMVDFKKPAVLLDLQITPHQQQLFTRSSSLLW